jgi:hypothetical protein
MSIGIGTLEPKVRVLRPVSIAGLLAVLVAFTFAVIVANSGDETAEPVRPQIAVSGTSANTPTELRGGFADSPFSGTAANTPTELRGGIAGSLAETPAIVPHVPRRAADATSIGGTLGNTPSELSGGLNGEICHQCR